MIEFLKFLHVAPLFAIVLLLLLPRALRILKKGEVSGDAINSALLLLSSVGIASGVNVHDHGATLFIDPCFGYAAVLAVVAVRLMGKLGAQKKAGNI